MVSCLILIYASSFLPGSPSLASLCSFHPSPFSTPPHFPPLLPLLLPTSKVAASEDNLMTRPTMYFLMPAEEGDGSANYTIMSLPTN